MSVAGWLDHAANLRVWLGCANRYPCTDLATRKSKRVVCLFVCMCVCARAAGGGGRRSVSLNADHDMTMACLCVLQVQMKQRQSWGPFCGSSSPCARVSRLLISSPQIAPSLVCSLSGCFHLLMDNLLCATYCIRRWIHTICSSCVHSHCL